MVYMWLGMVEFVVVCVVVCGRMSQLCVLSLVS